MNVERKEKEKTSSHGFERAQNKDVQTSIYSSAKNVQESYSGMEGNSKVWLTIKKRCHMRGRIMWFYA